MAFPSSQLALYAGIAPGADPAAPATWSFTEITDDVRVRDGVQISVGRQDESGEVDATKVQASLGNRAGHYTRVNPLGKWFGQLDKGSPLEIRVTRIYDTFTRSVASGLGAEADSGLTWSASATWTVNGNAAVGALASANSALSATLADAAGDDVEVSTVASLSAVATGAAWVHAIFLRYANGTNFYRFHTEFHLSGNIGVKIMKVSNGASSDVAAFTTTGITYTPGARIRTRVRANGATLQMRVWPDGSTEPSTWHLTATDDDVTGQGVGMYEWRVAGNTNAGTLTCTVDEFRADVIRASTPVPEWPVRWDQSGNNVTAPITGAGVLRRLSQGQAAIRSAVYRQLSGLSYTHGYWALEDGSDAAAASSSVAGGRPAIATRVQFGESDSPAGAAAAATLQTAGASTINGVVSAPATTPDGYAAMAFFKLGSSLGSTANMLRLSASGKVTRWQISASSTNFDLEGWDADGNSIESVTFVHGINVTKWFSIQLETNESGGTVNWSLIWNQVGSPFFTAGTGSHAGTADKITGFLAQAPVDNTSVSHVWLGDNDLPYVTTSFLAVSAGYAGETAGARLARLAADAGVPLRIFGDPADTAPMGPQRAATFIELARECEDADQGVLFETGAGLGYLTHAFRQNPPVMMALDFSQGHIAAPPEPTDDDQRLRNQIKLSRTGGSEVTAQDDASIAKSGTYADELTVNLQTDDLLADHASWRLHLGTFDDLRWPRIELQLHRNPSLIDDWCKIRVGSRITIANPPSAVGVDDLDLIVEGWTETLGVYSWDVAIACSPAALWAVGVYDDAGARYDSASTTLKAAVSSTATSLTFRTINPAELWSTTETPYSVLIGGERIAVTSMGAASLVSGAYDQAATVTRSVNGVVKAQTAGSEIHIADPARWAL